MDDAALVEAARSGDRAAWAAIYDRYADRLHDHCHRILRDRDEAADALHDAFLAASAHLHQLRDPSRLRPWLYSICRHESLRRVRQRSRVELTDEVDEMRSVDVDMERGTRSEELQELVWAAAAGLNPRDQALLDLNLRQGLEGQDLADAMGTSLNNSYVMLSRLRDQVERSLGALLIARLGRDDCEELDGILEGWDGRFSPLLRKRVARHVDGCDVCRERRAAVASPLALLAAMPIVPAPAMLRQRVLDGVGGAAEPQPIRFTREGFAAPAARRTPSRPAWWVAAALVVLAGVLGAIWATGGGDEGSTALAFVEDTTSTAPSTTSTSTTTTTAPTTTAPTTTTTTVAPADAPPSTEDPVVIPPPDTTPPDTTPPVIDSVVSEHSMIWLTGCPQGIYTSDIAAVVTGATGVYLSWDGPQPAGSKPMTRSGSTWTATFGPFTGAPSPMSTTYRVTAWDAAGNVATTTRPIIVEACPQ